MRLLRRSGGGGEEEVAAGAIAVVRGEEIAARAIAVVRGEEVAAGAQRPRRGNCDTAALRGQGRTACSSASSTCSIHLQAAQGQFTQGNMESSKKSQVYKGSGTGYSRHVQAVDTSAFIEEDPNKPPTKESEV
ncbi:hypothetical protein ACP4OV_009477 [Aristida adscensionis]